MVKDNSSFILTVVGVVGMAYSGINAVRKTPYALDLIEQRKEVISKETEEVVEKLTPVETIKTCWKVYAPEVLIATLSTVCLFKANSIQTRKTAAMATAYTLTEETLNNWKKKATEVLGEEKVEEIHKEVVQEKIIAKPVNQTTIVKSIYAGEALCRDTLSDRYFYIDLNRIKEAENRVNYRLRTEDDNSLNEYYDELGIPHTTLGDLLGWNIDRDGYFEIVVTPATASNGLPCLDLEPRELPKYDYYKSVY